MSTAYFLRYRKLTSRLSELARHRHILLCHDDVPEDDYSSQMKPIFVLDCTHRMFYGFTIALMVLNLVTYGSAIISTFFSCRPLQKLWYFWLDGTCIDRKSRHIVSAVFNVLFDLFLFFLPQSVIWRMKMSGSRRAGLSTVFAVGLL
jgi:hypothetical protein